MKGLSSLLGHLSALPAQAQAAVERAALEAARAAAQSAAQAAPVRTGALRASIQAKPAPKGSAVSAAVPYAGVVEEKKPYFAPAVRGSDFAARCARALREGLR